MMGTLFRICVLMAIILWGDMARAQYASAVAFPEARPSAYVQHGLAGNDVDWHCGGKSYTRDGYTHQGTDISIPWREVGVSYPHVPVRAGVAGMVTATYGDCADVCRTGDCICANARGIGNFVKLADRFGRERVFMHLRRGSIAVRPGDEVEADAVVGEVGSSGFSTGPHLHDELRDEGEAIEPFAGRCANEDAYLRDVSLWTEQGEYLGVPSGEAYSCQVEPGAYTDGYHDATSRRAFQRAYGLVRPDGGYVAAASRLGCPKTPDGAASPVHDVAGVEVQDFVQDDHQRRFPGSDDGHTALLRKPGSQRAHLLRSGFWGTYKCLPMNVDLTDGTVSGGMGGAVWLGAPLDDEHPPTVEECPNCTADPLAVRQNFERGYLSYAGDGVVRLHLSSGDVAAERVLAHAATRCGARLEVRGNPPQAPQDCAATGEALLTFDWQAPSGLAAVAVEVFGHVRRPDRSWSSFCDMGMAGSAGRWVCTLLVEPGAEVSFAVRYRMAVGGEGWVFDLSCSPTGGCGAPVGRVEVRQGSGVRPFILAWNGQGPRDPAVYMNGVVEASACSDGMTLADVGVSEASTHDGDDLVIRWRPPERFLSASTEARLMAWTDGRAEPPCLMEILGNGSYECRLHPSVGAELFFTIAFSGPLVPGGTGYAFDQSTSSTGGCLGRYPGCGADVGTVYVGKYASDVPFTRVWNGHGPADPPLYLNARIAHVP